VLQCVYKIPWIMQIVGLEIETAERVFVEYCVYESHECTLLFRRMMLMNPTVGDASVSDDDGDHHRKKHLDRPYQACEILAKHTSVFLIYPSGLFL
jgi:hypothetical protein